MSKNVRTAMARTRSTNDTARLVLCVLASCANKKLRAWPKQSTIALLTNRRVRAVQYALRLLEKLGEIRVVKHGQGRGSTEYYLAICAGEFDVIEPEGNVHGCAGHEPEETCTTKHVSKSAKPARRIHETRTSVHIEEIEDYITRPHSVTPSGIDRTNAQKGNVGGSSVLPTIDADIANGAVASHLSDHAREEILKRVEAEVAAASNARDAQYEAAQRNPTGI